MFYFHSLWQVVQTSEVFFWDTINLTGNIGSCLRPAAILRDAYSLLSNLLVCLKLYPSIHPSTLVWFSYSSLSSVLAMYPCTFMQLHESWSKAISWMLCDAFVHLCSVWYVRPSPHFCCFCGEVTIKPERDPFCFLLLGHFAAGAGSASVCGGLCGDLWLVGLLLA